jgi:iron(III) transport system permease protein
VRTIRQANRFQLVTGKSYRPLRYPLGRWRLLVAGFVFLYFCMQMLVPVGLLVWVSLQPYVQPPSFAALSQLTATNFVSIPWHTVLTGLENSVILMVAVPVLSLIVCFIYSWVVLRSRTRLRYVLDAVAFLPHAVPAIVFAVSGLLLALFVFRQIVPLYGTLMLLLGVHVMNRVSFGTRVTNSALIAVSEELEEAAQVCGGSKSNIVRRILLPLVSPALINAFFWISLLTLRELTLAMILYSPKNITLSVVIWSLWNSGEHGPSAAVSLIMLAIMLPVMLLGWRAGHHMTDSLTGVRRA